MVYTMCFMFADVKHPNGGLRVSAKHQIESGFLWFSGPFDLVSIDFMFVMYISERFLGNPTSFPVSWVLFIGLYIYLI